MDRTIENLDVYSAQIEFTQSVTFERFVVASSPEEARELLKKEHNENNLDFDDFGDVYTDISYYGIAKVTKPLVRRVDEDEVIISKDDSKMIERFCDEKRIEEPWNVYDFIEFLDTLEGKQQQFKDPAQLSML